MADFLTELEKAIANRQSQLSPEERKIQSKTNLDRMGKQQIDIRNAKAQEYLDKSSDRKMKQSPSYKAGRTSAQVQKTATEGLNKFKNAAIKTAQKVAPIVGRNIVAGARRSPIVAAAIEAVRAGKLATDEDYRKENEQAYDELADKNFLERAIEGGLGGVTSIYAAGKNIDDTVGAYTRAMKGDMAFQEKQKELIARGILDEEGKPIRRQEGPVASTEPQDDIRSMVEATGNALSAEPVLDEPTISEPIGNVSTDLGPPKAKVVIDENRMSALFRKTTGTNFDPKSKADKARMAELTSFIEQDPERLNKSDTKIALDFYRTL